MILFNKFQVHIPEEHEYDDPDFLNQRLLLLGRAGVTGALVALAKTDSQNTKELISRVFNAICSQQEVRGLIVQQGGAKALLPLALDGTPKGKKQAAQALARLAITINPEIAFPGQRIYEVIRPFVGLLDQECSALENFEALMALCNLASLNDEVRKRIIKENAFNKIESYMYEEHDMLRKASTQVINNLAMCEDSIPYYEKENDRVKYLVMLCEEEDPETSLAAAGALAMLSSASKIVCGKVFDSKSWLESLKFMLANPNQDLQHRGAVIVYNLMSSTKEIAQKLVDTDLMELLMALTKSELVQSEKVKKLAVDALEAAAKWQIIQKNKEEEATKEKKAEKIEEEVLDKVD